MPACLQGGYSWPPVSSLGSFVVMTGVGVCLDQKLTASFASRPRHELLFLGSDHGEGDVTMKPRNTGSPREGEL